MRAVRRSCFAAIVHRSVPLAEILRQVPAVRDGDAAAGTDVVFAHRRHVGDGLRLPGVTVERLPVDLPYSLYGLTMQVEEAGGGFSVELEGRSVGPVELGALWQRFTAMLDKPPASNPRLARLLRTKAPWDK